MRALVFGDTSGREVLYAISKQQGGMHDIRVVRHPHRTEVYIQRERESDAVVQAILDALHPLEAREVHCQNWEAWVANLQRTGIIPEGGLHPIQ
jgi:hypothetical protein